MRNSKSFNFIDKKVLLRCDFDVLTDKNGNILDDFKIKQALPAINFLLENRAKVILMGHLGDPGGKIVPELKMEKVAKEISLLLGLEVVAADDCVGSEVEAYANKLESGQIMLLENLKFYKEEEEGDERFAEKISFLGDIYLNNAFSECDKIYASITGVPQYLPSGTGPALESELENLEKIMENPERPFAVIIGGNVTDEKIKFIEKISQTADWILISGLIKGGLARKEMLFEHPDKIISPAGFKDNFDIGGQTIEIFRKKIAEAKTVFWYGALGQINGGGHYGTMAIAEAIGKNGHFSLVAGGDLVPFLYKSSTHKAFSHISSARSSLLKYMSGEALPGLLALK